MMGLVALVEMGSGWKGRGVDTRLSEPMEYKGDQWTAGGGDEALWTTFVTDLKKKYNGKMNAIMQ